MIKRTLSLLFVLCLLPALCACNAKTADAPGSPHPAADRESVRIAGQRADETVLTEGYIPSRISFPDWLARARGWSTESDTIWLSGVTPDRAPVIAAYDTLRGEWSRFDVSVPEAHNPQLGSVTLAGNSIWTLISDEPTMEDVRSGVRSDGPIYYLLHLDRASRDGTMTRIAFSAEEDPEGHRCYFSGLLALDDSRALLGSGDRFYIVDPNAMILAEPKLPVSSTLMGFRMNETRYLWSPEGWRAFDPETLSFGNALPIGDYSMLDSNAGRCLYSTGGMLYAWDPSDGREGEMFAWNDVLLSIRDMDGSTGFENSAGAFFYPGGDPFYFTSLVCAVHGQIAPRRTLRIGGLGEDGYTPSLSLSDAILRFNHTDTEYRIEIVPITWSGEQERDRVLVELATRNDLDLLDTSRLPESAQSNGLLADMLPMIDADETIAREDFLSPLLCLMLHDGGLYEYTERFTLLTMTTHPDLFPGRDGWTVEYIESLIDSHPEMAPLWHSYDRNLIATLFQWAATAEFIDRETGKCSFDSPAFVHWLELLMLLPDGSQYSEEPKLMNIDYDLAFNAGHQERYMMKGDYIVTGFPEAEGTGSYFLKLGSNPNEWRGTVGTNTRIGILSACGDQAGAWRFVRTLMEGSDEIDLSSGIPAFKSLFERAVTAQVSDDFDERFQIAYFTEENADELRKQVYGTTKLVDTDEGLMRIMQEEMNRFLSGQFTAKQAAAAIQSKATIYAGERYG